MNIDDIKKGLPNLHSAAISEKSLEELEHDRMLQKYAGRFNIYQKDFRKYKFRPHAIGNLMSSVPKPLTAKQEETLKDLQAKLDSGKNLTPPQYIVYGSLLEKKTAKPKLSPGAITYLKKIFKEITFQRTEELRSKYLDKGIIQEPVSIQMLQEFHGVEYHKNTERFENEYFSGEPDILEHSEVIDIKSSWDYTTFPMFDEELKNSDYYWQIMAYMDLTAKNKGRVIYVLVDTPQELIDSEKYRVSRDLGLVREELSFGLPDDLDFEIERNMTYEDIPQEGRIKEFLVYRNNAEIKLMKDIIDLARDFLVELNDSLEKRFVNHLK